ncbi:HAD family hydrolase [Paraoerskovia marina]|uniref:HAD family hydrolase n=1 Tax=Paraoerskovia marina TaxID=545619 RepID=UPI000492B4BF|nr:HAD family phosphatase [Paraoerskovia marina]
MTIDTVLYDFGNVLVGWDPRRALVGPMSPEDVDTFFREVDFDAYNRARDAGRTIAEEAELVAREHPEHAEAFALYIDRFELSLTGPVEGSAELVDELAEAGLRLFGLTNWSAELFGAAAHAAPATTRMEQVLVSGRERLVKPDPAIFRLARDRFGLDPTATVFVDDSAENVEAASALGFCTVRFRSTSQLRDELRRLGVDVRLPGRREPGA